jgi:hypothetical protein
MATDTRQFPRPLTEIRLPAQQENGESIQGIASNDHYVSLKYSAAASDASGL